MKPPLYKSNGSTPTKVGGVNTPGKKNCTVKTNIDNLEETPAAFPPIFSGNDLQTQF